MTLADRNTICLSSADQSSSTPEWAPTGVWIAYRGKAGENTGLFIAHPDGSSKRFLAAMDSTNSPLPMPGKAIAWSPDGRQIAYVSSQPGPETADATGDPMVLTRYLYRPTLTEGYTRFNDNKRLHIFIVDVGTGQTRQLSTGNHYEHSIDWSPDGRQIAFVSNREPDEDHFFNYDLFTVDVNTGEIRRLTATESAEYRPRWSPNGKAIVYQGTRRGLTDLETTMEDTHTWLIDADGKNRRELGGALDYRQLEPEWSNDGSQVFFMIRQRGSVPLYRMSVAGGEPNAVVEGPGTVATFSVHGNQVAYAFSTPDSPSELYLKMLNGPATKLTDLNHEVLSGKKVEQIESFTFISNDNKLEIEAFLTYPADFKPDRKYPLIVTIHGGPHLQQGPSFDLKNQVYASRGWATLMVNYRGSGGYGQRFLDALFGDQNGAEAQDVLYGVSAAMRRYLWIDRERLGIEGGSYGGQLTAWLITQTNIFKAAIPAAAIINLLSYNYMSYYNQYEQMEWGMFPHQGDLMNVLWERSPLKHVARVHTPTLLIHGENDNDVPIS